MSKLLIELFFVFFKIGAFTFGGGWAMISLIEREVVDNRHWLTKEDFVDLLAIAQSMPGILAVNIATVTGQRLCGLRGSIMAAMGTILPSFTIILLIAIFLTPETIKSNQVISRIFMGIRPAVVALIVVPVITTAKSVGITWRTVIIPIAVALLIYSKIPIISNPIIYVILGAVVGYVLYITRHISNKPNESL